MRFQKTFLPCLVTICAKIAGVDKSDFFDSDYELTKQFISINLVEKISSKRVKFWGDFVSSHIVVITTTWQTNFYQIPV